MIRKPLILIGGGGHCRSVIDVAESSGWSIKGILDLPSEVGKKILDYTIIGTDEDIPKYVSECFFVITIGQIKSSFLREKIASLILNAGGQLATIIASDSYVSKYSHIGAGSVIMHRAFVNSNVTIGANCIVNTMANIEHDVVIDNFCHISTGVMVNGGCKIGFGTFIGSSSVLAQSISLGSHVIIGAGSTVLHSLPPNAKAFGIPASIH